MGHHLIIIASIVLGHSNVQRAFHEYHVREVLSSILGGVNKDFFPTKFSLLTKACIRHKKVLTFPKIGCRCYKLFSHLPRYF